MPKIEDGMINRNSNLPTNTSSLQKILNLNTIIAEKNPESPFIHMSGDGDSVAGNLGEAKASDEGVSLQTINFENMVGYKNRARNNLRNVQNTEP